MKQITTIHARLSNPTYLSILWLLNKYGDIAVRDVVHVFGKSPQQIGFMLGQIEDAGLISRGKNPKSEDTRTTIITLSKEALPFYNYTLFMVNEDPDIKAAEVRYLEWVKSGR